MSEASENSVTPTTTTTTAAGNKSVRIIGIIVGVLGVIFVIAGITTYALVSQTLADQNITVSDDADRFAGEQVTGPFTAYAQADIINKHATEIAGGKTYAELPQDDPNRPTVMNASFLQASLFTSVVAFGVAAFVAVMGVIQILLGWALMKVGKTVA